MDLRILHLFVRHLFDPCVDFISLVEMGFEYVSCYSNRLRSADCTRCFFHQLWLYQINGENTVLKTIYSIRLIEAVSEKQQ